MTTTGPAPDQPPTTSTEMTSPTPDPTRHDCAGPDRSRSGAVPAGGAATVARRGVLGVGLAAIAAVATGCARSAGPTVAWSGAPSPTASGSGSPGPTATAGPTTRPSSTVDDNEYEARIRTVLTRALRPTTENPRHPTYAGAVALVLSGGAVAGQVVVGDALRFEAGPVELPPARRVAMRADSIFDLASLTKVYTAILALQQVDRGRIDPHAPIVGYLPGFAGAGKSGITLAHLLAHTSGLPVGATVSGLPDDNARRAAVLATPLIAGAVPGQRFRYSSVGLMVTAQLVEQVTGLRLDRALQQGLTEPLGLRTTGFTPLRWLPASARSRLVATDARSSRGLLRGVVHDDVANTLGGIAGHAGIFSTAAEVAVVAEMLRGRGTYRGVRILSPATVDLMLTNANPGLPATDPDRPHRSADHGLGVELNQPWFMGTLASPATFGHTGFTGTSFLVDQGRGLSVVLLTNRAHPNWSWANPDPVRAATASAVAAVNSRR